MSYGRKRILAGDSGRDVYKRQTLDQALHILLMYSANDAAMLIAENIGGSVDHFVEMMNEEAQRPVSYTHLDVYKRQI